MTKSILKGFTQKGNSQIESPTKVYLIQQGEMKREKGVLPTLKTQEVEAEVQNGGLCFRYIYAIKLGIQPEPSPTHCAGHDT
jgi:hypothetical protein